MGIEGGFTILSGRGLMEWMAHLRRGRAAHPDVLPTLGGSAAAWKMEQSASRDAPATIAFYLLNGFPVSTLR